MASDDHTTHLRRHLHSLVCRAGANFIQIQWDILCDDPGDSCWTDRRLGRLRLRSPVLNNPVRDEPGQKDEQYIRPLWNPLTRTANAIVLRCHRWFG